jgi:hypothetical protein
MARKQSVQEEIDEATLPIVPGRRTTRPRQTLLDPQAPMPGALKHVGPKRIESVKDRKKADPKHLRDRFSLYCRELGRTYGDTPRALALVFDIPLEDAQARESELHQEITRAVNTMSNKDLFDMHSISKPHRMMRIREIFYSDNLPAVLKATDMLEEMDSHAKSSGDTWEDWIASVPLDVRKR